MSAFTILFWGQQPQSPGGYLFATATFLFGDLPPWRKTYGIFSELMSDWGKRQSRRTAAPAHRSGSGLDFAQFFVDLTLHPFGSDTSLTLRVGSPMVDLWILSV